MEPRNHDGNPSPDHADLDAREHRTRLLTKLNCLIAVLEVAITKISRSLQSPQADRERLTRVRVNLENTLAICQRAKRTLHRSLAAGSPAQSASSTAASRMGYRDYVELSTIEEYRKFKSMPPIDRRLLEGVDIDALARELGQL
ncbi:MAG: hypothetical protein IPM29_31620 [Planctomycetes bacterium]|nr:hypothetical protein [Planctomycetota bacterium]